MYEGAPKIAQELFFWGFGQGQLFWWSKRTLVKATVCTKDFWVFCADSSFDQSYFAPPTAVTRVLLHHQLFGQHLLPIPVTLLLEDMTLSGGTPLTRATPVLSVNRTVIRGAADTLKVYLFVPSKLYF